MSITAASPTRTLAFDGHDASARQPAHKPPLARLCRGIGMGGALAGVRGLVSKKKRRFTESGFDLDLTCVCVSRRWLWMGARARRYAARSCSMRACAQGHRPSARTPSPAHPLAPQQRLRRYITPNVIAMGFPSSGREGLYRNPLPEVQRFFETRHSGRYRIYNLCSERAYDASDFLGRVVRMPFDDHNPCQVEVIPRFCADIDSWLSKHSENVVAIHCKAGKGRTGMMIACFLLHCGFRNTAEGALRWFGNVRTANGKGVTIPSQMRCVLPWLGRGGGRH